MRKKSTFLVRTVGRDAEAIKLLETIKQACNLGRIYNQLHPDGNYPENIFDYLYTSIDKAHNNIKRLKNRIPKDEIERVEKRRDYMKKKVKEYRSSEYKVKKKVSKKKATKKKSK